jgi:serine protease Do
MIMNSAFLWWTARLQRPLQVTRVKSNLKPSFASRLARAAMAAALALPMGPLAAVTVRAQDGPAQTGATAVPQIQVDSTPLNRNAGAISSYAPIVDKVGPSIVEIFTEKDVKVDANPFGGNPMMRRFFGLPDNSGPDDQESGKVEGLGSGIIVSSDGLILTNNHVAESGDKIKVRIGEHGHEYDAKVVGHDPTSDIALLQIDAKNLPVMTFADSDQVKVGDVVLAVGSPFGLTNTVTMGIVSALGRGGMGITDYEDFIQTDAAINPGNSGGALVDTEGRLIGINTAIAGGSGGNEGIGFAVPSDLAHNVIDSLLKYGKVTRGFLGAGVQGMTPDIAEQLKVPDDQQGAVITEVLPGSAAEKFGLQSYDIITAVNDKAITDPQSLRLTVGGMSPGDKVTVTYLRDGQTKTADITLGSEEPSGELADNTAPQGKSNVLDGITVGDLNESNRTQYKVPDDIKGVLVTDVASDSVGADAGLKEGDVILEMDRKPLASADDAVTAGNNIDKDARVLLHVWSGGRSEFLVLKPKEA